MTMKPFFCAAFLSVLCCAALPAHAQTASVSPTAAENARAIAQACPADWQAPACLRVVSASNLVLASNYGSALQQAGHADAAEQIKQHCAASTAGTRGDYPAYAMRSAFTECANTMSDIAQSTGIAPDASHFQLLVIPTLCLSGDPRCAAASQGLQAYAH